MKNLDYTINQTFVVEQLILLIPPDDGTLKINFCSFRGTANLKSFQTICGQNSAATITRLEHTVKIPALVLPYIRKVPCSPLGCGKLA